MEISRSIRFGAVLSAILLSMTLAAGLASAQSITARENAGLPVSSPGPQVSTAPQAADPLAPAPAYCSPCLYYSGDMDVANSPDGLLNGNLSIFASFGQTFTPFAVPAGHTWYVTGFVVNEITPAGSVHVPKKAGWSIWRGVASGVPGTLVQAGTSRARFKATGRGFSSYTEYTVSVTLSQPIWLGGGASGQIYFLNVMPQCTDSTSCSSQLLYESNVTDSSPAHHHGLANILNDSFILAPFGSYNYIAATSQGSDFHLFSFGVIGTCTVNATGTSCYL